MLYYYISTTGSYVTAVRCLLQNVTRFMKPHIRIPHQFLNRDMSSDFIMSAPQIVYKNCQDTSLLVRTHTLPIYFPLGHLLIHLVLLRLLAKSSPLCMTLQVRKVAFLQLIDWPQLRTQKCGSFSCLSQSL